MRRSLAARRRRWRSGAGGVNRSAGRQDLMLLGLEGGEDSFVLRRLDGLALDVGDSLGNKFEFLKS